MQTTDSIVEALAYARRPTIVTSKGSQVRVGDRLGIVLRADRQPRAMCRDQWVG